METISINAPVKSPSKKMILTGRIMSGLCIAFLLVDAIMKIIMNPFYVEGSARLGWSESAVQPIGFVLLICTILYIIPRTAILGAILLTGYLGGAVANMGLTHHSFLFPVIFGVFVWGGLFLLEQRVRSMFI